MHTSRYCFACLQKQRRCGSIRLREIIEDLPAVLAMLRRVEAYFAQNPSITVAGMLLIFGESSIYTSVPSYKNVRCCRILAEAAGKRFQDCIADFEVFKRMSRRMRYALTSRGIDDFKTATKFVKGMKAATGLE